MPYKNPSDKNACKRRRRKAKRAALVDLMGGYCRLCLTQGPSCIFDFHHCGADPKEFGLEQHKFALAWSHLLKEAEKCVLLCANCHRELHATD